jgi:hypothetical protein
MDCENLMTTCGKDQAFGFGLSAPAEKHTATKWSVQEVNKRAFCGQRRVWPWFADSEFRSTMINLTSAKERAS